MKQEDWIFMIMFGLFGCSVVWIEAHRTDGKNPVPAGTVYYEPLTGKVMAMPGQWKPNDVRTNGWPAGVRVEFGEGAFYVDQNGKAWCQTIVRRGLGLRSWPAVMKGTDATCAWSDANAGEQHSAK